MYVYDEYDQRIIEDRVKQFRDQTRRYLAGELSEEEFRPPAPAKWPLHPAFRADVADRGALRPTDFAPDANDGQDCP